MMTRYLTIIILIISAVFPLTAQQTYYQFTDSADFYINNGELNKAEQAILGALRLEPANFNNSLLLSNLATLQRRQGRYAESLSNYSLALNIAPNSVTLLNNRGKLLFQLDSLDAALNDFNKVARLDANDIISRYYAAKILLRRADNKAANEIINQLRSINSKSLEYKDLSAQRDQLAGKFDDAIRQYGSLIKDYPENEEWLMHRAECYIQQHRYPLAQSDLNDAITINPNDGYLYLLKALIYKMQYQDSDSKKYLDKAVEHGISRRQAEALLMRSR